MGRIKKGNTVIPRDPENDEYFQRKCGHVPKMVNFIGKKCNIMYVAEIDGTAEIENLEGDTLFWTLKHLEISQ